MKVLHVISDRNIGGAGILLCNLLRHFDRRRTVSLVALPRGSALIPRIKAIGVPVVELEFDCSCLTPASVHELVRIICARGITLVHANAALSARMAARLCCVPVVHTRHCCYPVPGAWQWPLVGAICGGCNRMLSDCVIATAEAAKKNLLDLGIPGNQIRVIINGSDPVRKVSERELDVVRKRYALREDDFVIGICARLESCKGHETLLHAAEEAMERMPSMRFRFLIVGGGSRLRELRRMAELLGISHAVRFLGFVNDMAPVYRLMRINVNCSVGTETSSLALSEGMSAGVPVVATRYGGNPAMVGAGYAGILFAVGDHHALADAICKIAGDPVLEARMRAAAYARYERHFTAERMTREVEALYRELDQ